jgi:cobalt-zinc-cadmium efflux system outer membrane protein
MDRREFEVCSSMNYSWVSAGGRRKTFSGVSWRIVAVPGWVLFLTGCFSTSPDPEHMARIDRMVMERTGSSFRSEELLKSAFDPGASTAGETLTLEEAVARTLARNFSLIAQAETIAVAQAQLAQAGLPQNPSVGVSLRRPHPGGLLDLDVNITQTINSFLTLGSRIDMGLVQRYQSGIDLASSAFDLSQQVESKYRAMAHLLRTRSLASKIVDQYDRAYQAAQARAKVGVIPTPDVNRARLQWEDAQRQVKKMEAQYRRTAWELNWLMGIPSAPTWRLPAGVAEVPKELPALPELGSVEEMGRRFRLDLRRADFDRQMGEANVRLARWGFIPAITLGADRERDFDNTVKYGGVLAFTLPIFDPGFVAYDLARAQLRQARKTYLALEGQVGQDVRSAYATVELDVDDIRFYRDRIIPQQEENIRLAEASFRLGNSDLDSLLNTLHDYVGALQGYEDSIQSYYDDLVALQRAVGLVWARLVEEDRKKKEEPK